MVVDKDASAGDYDKWQLLFYVQDKLECRLSLLTRLNLAEKKPDLVWWVADMDDESDGFELGGTADE